MIARLQPSAEQIKFHLEGMLNNFETLDAAMAIEVTKRDIRAIISYLDTINSANNVRIFLLREGSKLRIGIEGFVEDTQVIN